MRTVLCLASLVLGSALATPVSAHSEGDFKLRRADLTIRRASKAKPGPGKLAPVLDPGAVLIERRTAGSDVSAIILGGLNADGTIQDIVDIPAVTPDGSRYLGAVTDPKDGSLWIRTSRSGRTQFWKLEGLRGGAPSKPVTRQPPTWRR